MTLAEPDVTLTDSVLTIECAILAWLPSRLREAKATLQGWFVIFFCATGLAVFMGGTIHGFIHDKASLLHTVVWYTTLLASGVATLSAWMSGTNLVFHARARKTC